MIVQLLSVADLVVAVLLVYHEALGLSWFVALYCALYLLIKAVMYYKTAVSWVDGLVGVYLLAVSLGASGVLSYIGAAWLFFKAAPGLLFQKK